MILVFFKGSSSAVFSLILVSTYYFELPEYIKYLLDLWTIFILPEWDNMCEYFLSIIKN